jgi:hypothetical protein
MKRLSLEQKALRVIDWLVSDDLSEISNMKSSRNHAFTQEEAKGMADKITHIYEISHSAIPEHSCFHVHDGWRGRTLTLFENLQKHKQLGG